MHITKKEFKTLVRSTLAPTHKELICAINDVEAAVLAPLVQSLSVQSVAQYDNSYSEELKGGSATIHPTEDVYGVNVILNGEGSIKIEILKSDDKILTQFIEGGGSYKHTSKESIIAIIVTEQNDVSTSVEINY